MSLNQDIQSAIKGATKDWKKAKHKADKEDRVSRHALYRVRYQPSRYTIRDAAFKCMKDAYNKASSNGKYYANARQIMYAARPAILREIEEDEFSSVYFTQTLLKDYLETYRPAWKVVWDARGHLIEPYTNKSLGLGGIEVTEYEGKWTGTEFNTMPSTEFEMLIKTVGPTNRFNSALFIEKEGFTEILQDAEIPERYSMALMSTKGVPVKACCDVIRSLTARGVRVFVLHDFDYAGFKILRTLRKGTRLASGSHVIDLGLRMADISGLESESVTYDQRKNPAYYLEICGATSQEIEFLVNGQDYGQYQGERVEINAMTSEELISWLDKKFKEHGVEKYIPDEKVIIAAHKRAVFLQRIEKKIDELESEIKKKDIDYPKEFYREVVKEMNGDGTKSWDEIVWELVADEDEEETTSDVV